jgi:hypothetical protein
VRTEPRIQDIHADLLMRLQARRSEIEQATMTRAYSIADPTEVADPAYAQGLRAAVSAALEYGLAAIECGEERAPPVPEALRAQARIAARNGVSLDTVLRRCFAGYTLLGDFLMQEAEEDGLQRGSLKRLLLTQATLFDRLLAAVTGEYTHEARSRATSTEQRRAERVQKLLDGELLDTGALEYDFDGHHLGLIASGLEAAEAIQELAKSLDRRLLLVRRDEELVWAWLGGRGKVDLEQLDRLISKSRPSQLKLVIGEPAQGLAGWRLTHRQAAAALPIAQRGPDPFVRYVDVALLASVLHDDVLTTSIRQLYLAPLEAERDGGKTLRETLRAYFAAERNVSSAAAILGLSRQAVGNRLRLIEHIFGRTLDRCASEIELALRLESVGSGAPPKALRSLDLR